MTIKTTIIPEVYVDGVVAVVRPSDFCFSGIGLLFNEKISIKLSMLHQNYKKHKKISSNPIPKKYQRIQSFPTN
jgi:hypothetical protein